jgi:sugar lactone lactonase YvrE
MSSNAFRRAGTLRILSTIFLLSIVATLSGCAGKVPAHLPAEAKAQLGTVGVASARFTPRLEFRTPAKGAWAGAGRRATRWAAVAGGAVGQVGCAAGGYACIGALALAVAATVGGAVAGGVSGAIDALPADTVREVEAALTRSLGELRLQEELRDRVVQVARQKTLQTVVTVMDHGPSSPGKPARYDPEANRGIDSLLETTVLTVGLAGEWDVNPPLKLVMTGLTRLVRIRDGAEIYRTPLEYSSEAHPFIEWGTNEAQPFRDGLDRALHVLAAQVVREYFVLRPQELDTPSGVAVDAAGNLFIADQGNHRILKVEAPAGLMTTVAGTGEYGFAGDGGPATSAQLEFPAGIAVDPAGNLFIADQLNQRIRKVGAATGWITTVAGTGQYGFAGDGGPATSARLNFPARVGVDQAGNLFIADQLNHRIRRVEAATGWITTVAGTGQYGFGGDGGPATSAQLANPTGIAVDATGNLFVADQSNQRIRKVDATTGWITTVAGTGEPGFAGDGSPATSAYLDFPSGIAVDSTGNFFIADQGNRRIRKVEAATGFISTVAGTGESGFSGDGGPATSAQLARPSAIALDASGNLFIADQGNHRIREIVTSTGIITTVAGAEERPDENAGERGPATSPSPAAPEGAALDPSPEP